MSMQAEPERKRKTKKQPASEFDAEKVFGIQPAVDLSEDLDMARYEAQKGEGGDRRA